MFPLLLALLLSTGPEKAVTDAELRTTDAVDLYDDVRLIGIATNGDLSLVVWQDMRSDLSQDVFAARIASSGEVLDPSGILVATAETYDITPRVVWTGTRFLVTWFARDVTSSAGGETRIAEIDTNGRVLPPEGTKLIDARVDELANNGAATLAIVRTADQNPSFTIGRIGPGGELSTTAALGSVFQPKLVATESGFAVGWLASANNGCVPELLRLDASGAPIGGAHRVSELATGSSQCSMGLASRGDELLLAVADGNALRSARIASNDSVQIELDVASAEERWVHEVIAHPDAYDVIVSAGEQLHVVRAGAGTIETGGPVLTARGVTVGGRTLLAWVSYEFTEGRNLFAKFVGDDEEIVVSRSAPNQQLPSLATDGDSVLAVWKENRGRVDLVVVARPLQRDGTPAGSPITVTTAARSYFDKAPTATVFDGRDYLVVWQESRGPSEELYQGLAARRISAQFELGESFLISGTAHIRSAPAIASDGENALLVWTDGYYAAPSMRAVLLRRGETTVGSPIALPAAGNAAVVWNGETYLAAGETGRAIRAMVLDRSGALVSASDATLPPADTNDSAPSIAWNGHVHLLVYQRRGGIFATMLDRSGARIGGDFALYSGNAYRSRVVAGGASFLVTWERGDSAEVDYHDILAARISGNGDVGDAFVVSATPMNDAAPALLSIDPARTLIAYQRLSPETSAVHRVFTRMLQSPPRRRTIRH